MNMPVAAVIHLSGSSWLISWFSTRYDNIWGVTWFPTDLERIQMSNGQWKYFNGFERETTMMMIIQLLPWGYWLNLSVQALNRPNVFSCKLRLPRKLWEIATSYWREIFDIPLIPLGACKFLGKIEPTSVTSDVCRKLLEYINILQARIKWK